MKTREQHGYTNHPLYKKWNSMKSRCLNKNNAEYKNYGGRGITICEEWRNSAKLFIDWSLANGWKKGLEIDRIDNNRTHRSYSPENCHYVTPRENSSNKRKESSLVTGVVYEKTRNKYKASIRFKGQHIYLGRFNSEREASKTYQTALNSVNNGVKPEVKKTRHIKGRKVKRKFDLPPGVSSCGNKFRAFIHVKQNQKRKQLHLGLFDTPEQASVAFQNYCISNNLQFINDESYKC